MITIYDQHGQRLDRRGGGQSISSETVWIDLLNPTREEDLIVEQQLNIAIPTRDETREIEASNRLYAENGAHYMTVFILYNSEQLSPSSSTLTFILSGNRLITVRYSEPRAIPQFLARAEKGDMACNSGAAIMAGILESIINRSADLIERIQDEVEKTAQSVFELKGGQHTRGRRLDLLLKAAGKEGDITSRAQESAFSLERLLTYYSRILKDRPGETAILQRVEIMHRDTHSLIENMRFLADRITFLLDATLGMISIEQNQTMKIFSLFAVTLMPPTLIGAIYGMNFKHMPELEWIWGYPIALVLMVLSGLLPFLYFRRKGWI